MKKFEFLDFEKISLDVDALWVTSRGVKENRERFEMPNISGIDFESILWFNIKHIRENSISYTKKIISVNLN